MVSYQLLPPSKPSIWGVVKKVHHSTFTFMFRLSFLCTCFASLLLLSLGWSCSGDPSQNAFPKKLPVDRRAEQEQEAIRQEKASAASLETWQDELGQIEALLTDHALGHYVVRDGDGSFVAESTTFYAEEAKKTPLKTKIIYLTGDYDVIYWLKEDVTWVERGATQHIFKGQTLAVSLQDGQPFTPTQSDQNELAKVPPLAKRLLKLPAANLE